MPRAFWAAVAVLVSAGVTTGCASGSGALVGSGGQEAAGTDRIRVVAALYPLAYLAEQVGGDAVSVSTLAPPGVEPHDLELSPPQVAEIADADLVLYIPGLQPAVDEAIAQSAPESAFDVTTTITRRSALDEAGQPDPHVWLDPTNMAAMGRAVADRIDDAVPEAASRSASFADRMGRLATDIRTGLANCRIRDVVVTHESFGYLTDAVGLNQVGLSGLDPQAEPSPAHLAEIADLVRTNGITTIYTEPLIPAETARTIADETGTTTAVLDPIEALPPDATADYESTMRANLAALRLGQDCP